MARNDASFYLGLAADDQSRTTASKSHTSHSSYVARFYHHVAREARQY